jgi:glutamate-1-semialdehyde 2,1-aminomutase
MTTIEALEKEFVSKHAKSKQLYERARECFPSGVTHDSRIPLGPFPIYASKAVGTKKWDVDGNEYIDYVMGHGALILGYQPDKVLTAFTEQIPKGIHMGASTELEIEWAELIRKLVPSAKDGFVRACSCGSEAADNALRLARIYTGRDKVVLHSGCYHGKGVTYIYGSKAVKGNNIRGITEGVKEDVITIPSNNLSIVEEVFSTEDVACIFFQGNALYTKEYIEGIRKLTRDYGVVFVLDEVVSGFRYALGGAQGYYGVTPDISILGKIPGGGAPIGAVCGKKEILEFHSRKDSYWNRFIRIAEGGTWNAQPNCIVGGIAMMKILDKERNKIYPRLYEIGKKLTKGINEWAEELGVAALSWGFPIDNPTLLRVSLFNQPVPEDLKTLWKEGPSTFEDYDTKASYAADPKANKAVYFSTINDGVFTYGGTGGVTCAVYTDEEIERTINIYGEALKVVKDNDLAGTL